MQTSITYRHGPASWKSPLPEFDDTTLPRTVSKLLSKEPLSIVVLGDSISAGANSSKLAKAPPFQPAYPELVQMHLVARFRSKVDLKNLSVDGKDSKWGLTQIDTVADASPDLVILAFGMNDSAGRSAKDYQANTQNMIAKIREQLPDAEFILVASMRGGGFVAGCSFGVCSESPRGGGVDDQCGG